MNNYLTSDELAEAIRERFPGMPENVIEKCVRHTTIADDPVCAVVAHIRRHQTNYDEQEILTILSGWQSPKGCTRSIAANVLFTLLTR